MSLNNQFSYLGHRATGPMGVLNRRKKNFYAWPKRSKKYREDSLDCGEWNLIPSEVLRASHVVSLFCPRNRINNSQSEVSTAFWVAVYFAHAAVVPHKNNHKDCAKVSIEVSCSGTLLVYSFTIIRKSFKHFCDLKEDILQLVTTGGTLLKSKEKCFRTSGYVKSPKETFLPELWSLKNTCLCVYDLLCAVYS